jgi:endonuclease/exonuclease/phosphatase family metal-dependent hydrolase
MRIGTYNVLGFGGYPPAEARKALGDVESEATAAHFQRVFTELDCDILALQEGGSARQISRISRAMGQNAATFPSPGSWPGHLLTPYPILESRTFSHVAPDYESQPLSRTAGAALLQIGQDLRLWVFVLHLYPSSVEMREREAEIILARTAELLRDTPNVVVLGDFNCPVTERVHGDLKRIGFTNAMEAAGGGVVPTMDTAGVTLRSIDHIYLSPTLRPYLTGTEVVRLPGYRDDSPPREGAWVHSDHLPVLATLSLPDEKTPGT